MRNGLAGDVMKTLAWITVTGPRHYNLGGEGTAGRGPGTLKARAQQTAMPVIGFLNG